MQLRVPPSLRGPSDMQVEYHVWFGRSTKAAGASDLADPVHVESLISPRWKLAPHLPSGTQTRLTLSHQVPLDYMVTRVLVVKLSLGSGRLSLFSKQYEGGRGVGALHGYLPNHLRCLGNSTFWLLSDFTLLSWRHPLAYGTSGPASGGPCHLVLLIDTADYGTGLMQFH